MVKKVILTEDEIKSVIRASYGVWNAIGPDMLAAGGEMRREEVIEVVLDSGHLETYARPQDRDAIKKLREMSHTARKKIMTDFVFEYELYGY